MSLKKLLRFWLASMLFLLLVSGATGYAQLKPAIPLITVYQDPG